MAKHVLLLALAAISLAFPGCSASPEWNGEFPALVPRTTTPEPLTLKAGGAPGQRFTLALDVDGTPQTFTGETPAEYPLHCSVLTGEVTRDDASDAPLSLEVQRANGNSFFTAHVPAAPGVCRFRYHDGSIEVLCTTKSSAR